MNNKKVKILLSSILTGAIVTGTAIAINYAQDNVNGNAAAMGEISIDAREVSNKPLDVSNLLSGEAGNPGTVDLYNDGTREQAQYMNVENISGTLCDYVNLKVGYSYDVADVFSVVFGIYNLRDLEGEGNRIEVGRSHSIGANITTKLVQQASLDSDTPNEEMGKNCTWDEHFTGEQVVTQ